jgi:Fe-S cluster assembly iron-binding protein IscA
VLELTPEAVEVITTIVADSDVGPDGALRISASSDGNGDAELEFELAAEPIEGDEVIRSGSAVVFLDAVAAEELADKTLNVHSHGDHFHFSLDERDSDG